MKLTAFERRWAEVIGRGMFPKGSLGGTVDDRDIGAAVADQVAAIPWWGAVAVRFGLFLVWFAPFLRFRLRTFGTLSAAEQEQTFERLTHSHLYWLRESAFLLKMQFCFALVGDERFLRHLGAYDLKPAPVALQRKAS